MYPNLSTSLILLYLVLSFAYSIIEKLKGWEECTVYYKDHFKGTALKNHVVPAIILVLVLEIISVVIGFVGLFYLLDSTQPNLAIYAYLTIVATLVVLMTGQRIAQDYSGAMNITVYFILSVLGLYILEIS